MSYKGIRNTIVRCAICNKKFNPYRVLHLYCSKKCYMRYYRKRTRETSSLRRLKKRKLICLKYGNKCNCCGESEFRFLTIDHVNNDGYLESRNSSESYLNSIIKRHYSKKYQILCMNCNFGKKFDGTCPHKKRINKNVV